MTRPTKVSLDDQLRDLSAEFESQRQIGLIKVSLPVLLTARADMPVTFETKKNRDGTWKLTLHPYGEAHDTAA